MNMRWMKAAFAVSAVYDGIVAIVFLFFGFALFDYFGIERPNHAGYLQFPSLLLIVFAIMYWRIASDPVRFRDLIPYGIGLKVSYSAVVFYHWLTAGIPAPWIPFAWIDLGFLILFIQVWRKTRPVPRVAA
jgi:hypothetical protein